MHRNDILTAENVSIDFGGVRALKEVSVHARAGEILSIIGPNGAGKTTLFNVITGTYTPACGNVTINGRPSAGLSLHEITRLGISRTFQNLKPFSDMSVTDNVMVGREIHFKYGLFSALFRTARFTSEERTHTARVNELVDFVGLYKRRHELARNLTYGEQKLLEIARALAVEPSILLLDEPVAGMNPTETSFVMDLVRRVRAMNITVLIIEHDMKMVMGISDRIYVLDQGTLIAEGTPDEIRADRRVIEAYLGSGSIAAA